MLSVQHRRVGWASLGMKVMSKRFGSAIHVALMTLTVGGIGATYTIFRDRGPTPEQVAAGRVLFEHEWTPSDPMAGGDGLGPVFNERSCVACHFQGGVGGSGPVAAMVNTFEIINADDPEHLITGVIHKDAVDPEAKETGGVVRQMFGGQSDVETIEVRSVCNGLREVQITRTNPVIFHQVDSPPLFGLALIDGISDWDLFRLNAARIGKNMAADFRGEFRRNGKGVARMHAGGHVGKFGWKGQFASLDDFIATACAMELGLSNSKVSQPLPNKHRGDDSAQQDMSDEQLQSLVAFVRSLPRPEQVLPEDVTAREFVADGEAAFAAARCTDCHVPDVGDVQGLYSDFQLYELDEKLVRRVSGGYGGGGPGDPPPLFDWPEHLPSANDWQTPPLWGVADSAPYLHDGSAATLEVAIERHGGDAEFSRKLYRAMSTRKQESILAFLRTLRAPSLEVY